MVEKSNEVLSRDLSPDFVIGFMQTLVELVQLQTFVLAAKRCLSFESFIFTNNDVDLNLFMQFWQELFPLKIVDKKGTKGVANIFQQR